MILFWLGISSLSVIAVGILLWPVFSHRRIAELEPVQLSILLYKQKLQNLDQEKNQDEISEEAYQQTRALLEKSLLLEAGSPSATELTPKKFNVSLLIVLPVIMIAFAILLYLIIGSSRSLADYRFAQENAAQTTAEIKQLGSIDEIINRLEQQLAKKPDSRGWYLLGRLYMKNQQLPRAIQAFEQAERLQSDQPEVLVAHAQALYLLNNHLTPAAKELLQKVLVIEPKQLDALGLLALDAFQQQQYTQAITYWEQLLPQLSPQSQAAQNIQQMIALAEQKIGQSAGPGTAAKIKLHIHVTLKPDYQQQVTGDEALFIYAQAVTGPAMPLAVVRHTVKDLPLTVTLDQTMAMLPNMTLANADQVRIKARISKTGQPLPSPGDLEGSSTIIDPHHPPATIPVIINQENQAP